MKFEFDNKTGNMIPKKDGQIYFAGSMGGGLRIDDHKHNIKYIIERNGELTILQGAVKNLHIYDQRDSHIIADRVARKFGGSHKYANYRKFMSGLSESSLIKNFDDFVNEGMTGLYDRWKSGDVRKEDKYNPEYVDFGDGTTVLWSIHNLEVDGRDLFSWTEIHDCNLDGWRLPTLDEVKQLDFDGIRICGMRDDGHFYQIMKFTSGQRFYILDDDNKIFGGFGMWTSDESKGYKTSAMQFGFDNLHHFSMTDSGKFNKKYVFLVKDK